MYKENSFYHSFIADRRIPLLVIERPILVTLHNKHYRPDPARHREWKDVRGSRMQNRGKILELPLEGRSLRYVDGAYELHADDLVFKGVWGKPEYVILRLDYGRLIGYHKLYGTFDSRGGKVTIGWEDGSPFTIGYRWP
jgi:hypothetical protein